MNKSCLNHFASEKLQPLVGEIGCATQGERDQLIDCQSNRCVRRVATPDGSRGFQPTDRVCRAFVRRVATVEKRNPTMPCPMNG